MTLPPYAKCLTCARRVYDHPIIAEWWIEASRVATFDEPVYIDGWSIRAPLSPSLIGIYYGHDPMVTS